MADDEAIEEGRYSKMPWVLNEPWSAAMIRAFGVAKVPSGWSISAVTIDWQKSGPAPPGNTTRTGFGSRSAIPRNVKHLTTSAKTGDLPDGRRHHIIGRGNWPAIIDDATFRRV